MGNNKDWILSYTGRRINLLEPDPGVICIEDIAHALARLCRFTGHTDRFYSVAEHSVRVSWQAEALQRRECKTEECGAGGRVCERMAGYAAADGLLHDATEAYLGDVSRPLKRLPGMEAYKALEERWAIAIAERFGVVPNGRFSHRADTEMLYTEAHHLMKPHSDWVIPEPLYMDPWFGWPVETAEDIFLTRFKALFPEEAGK